MTLSETGKLPAVDYGKITGGFMNALSKVKMLLAVAAVCGLGIFAGCSSKDESGQSEEKMPVYTSEALLEVSLPISYVFTSDEFKNQDVLEQEKMTKIELMFADEVLAAAAANEDLRKTGWYKTGEPDAAIGRLKKDVKAASIPKTMFIRVSMSWSDKDSPAVVVNTVCDTFVNYMKQQADKQTSEEIWNLEKERTRLEGDSKAVTAKLEVLHKCEADPENQAEILDANKRALVATVAQLEQMATEADTNLKELKEQKESGELSKNPEVRYYVDNDPTLRGMKTQINNIKAEIKAVQDGAKDIPKAVEELQSQLEKARTVIDELEKKLVKENEDRVLKGAEENCKSVAARLAAIRKEVTELQKLSEGKRDIQPELENTATRKEVIEDKIGRIERRLLELQLLRETEEPVKVRSRAVLVH